MSATQTVFLALVSGGVLALLAGLFLTRWHWRQDIPPYGRHMRVLDVTRHPERYATDAPFGVIRSLGAIGAVLLASAAAAAVWEILRTMLSP